MAKLGGVYHGCVMCARGLGIRLLTLNHPSLSSFSSSGPSALMPPAAWILGSPEKARALVNTQVREGLTQLWCPSPGHQILDHEQQTGLRRAPDRIWQDLLLGSCVHGLLFSQATCENTQRPFLTAGNKKLAEL